jgi:hydrogenase nickel incorporation protein HypB
VWRKSAGKAAFLGTDKLLKCPIIFNSADVAVITKVDLATAVEFNSVAANRNIQAVRPGMTALDVSTKFGEGMEEFLDFLRSRRSAAGVTAVSQGAGASTALN